MEVARSVLERTICAAWWPWQLLEEPVREMVQKNAKGAWRLQKEAQAVASIIMQLQPVVFLINWCGC